MIGSDTKREKRAAGDDGPRAVSGAGAEEAAFPVGVLAGAAIGGVGGALVGDETAARGEGEANSTDADRETARKPGSNGDGARGG